MSWICFLSSAFWKLSRQVVWKALTPPKKFNNSSTISFTELPSLLPIMAIDSTIVALKAAKRKSLPVALSFLATSPMLLAQRSLSVVGSQKEVTGFIEVDVGVGDVGEEGGGVGGGCGRTSTWTNIGKLTIVASVMESLSLPLQPTLRADEVSEFTPQQNGCSNCPPWASEAVFLVSISSDSVELSAAGLPHYDSTCLDHCGTFAEDEIDCARDGAVAVELTVCVVVQCVLVPLKAAVENCGHIPLHPKCYSLMCFWPTMMDIHCWLHRGQREDASGCSI
ncbi:hypothetical protein Leryth_005258 [Lithospermum erythrorhizon]|nr:hypothetical protein Leryth_005258 [Lithospermum erythrorhizon]